MVIDLTSDTEEPMEAQPEQKYPGWEGFLPGDISVTDTSDTEYIPSGRPYVPAFIQSYKHPKTRHKTRKIRKHDSKCFPI